MSFPPPHKTGMEYPTSILVSCVSFNDFDRFGATSVRVDAWDNAAGWISVATLEYHLGGTPESIRIDWSTRGPTTAPPSRSPTERPTAGPIATPPPSERPSVSPVPTHVPTTAAPTRSRAPTPAGSTKWRIRATAEMLRNDLYWYVGTLRLYSNPSCSGNVNTGGAYLESGHGFGAQGEPWKAFNFYSSSYWIGTSDSEGNWWVGMEFEDYRDIQCVRYNDNRGAYNIDYGAKELVVEAWNSGKEIWVKYGEVLPGRYTGNSATIVITGPQTSSPTTALKPSAGPTRVPSASPTNTISMQPTDSPGESVSAAPSRVVYPERLVYLGCYKDKLEDRALPHWKGARKSFAECTELCEGYKYFNVAWFRQCFCGNGDYAKHGEGEGCDCDAEKISDSQWLGCAYGYKRLAPSVVPSVSSLPSIAPTDISYNYLGCFKDSAKNRALPVYKGRDKTFDECASLCANYNFFGRQGPQACYCGDIGYDKYGPADGCDCEDTDIGTDKNCVYTRRRPAENPSSAPTVRPPGAPTSPPEAPSSAPTRAPVAAPTTRPAPVFKRGLSFRAAQNCHVLDEHAAVSWWHSWSDKAGFSEGFCDDPQAAASDARTRGQEFVPMFAKDIPQKPFGVETEANLQAASYLMTFDRLEESLTMAVVRLPDGSTNIAPNEAARLWPQIVSIADEYDLEIVAPCVDIQEGGDWITEWLGECEVLYGEPCRFDYTCLRAYYQLEPCIEGEGACLSEAMTDIDEWMAEFGKPAWVTEFACTGKSECTAEQHLELMHQSVPMLDASDAVYRYAWFAGHGAPSERGNTNEIAWEHTEGKSCNNKKYLKTFGESSWMIKTNMQCLELAEGDSDCYSPLTLHMGKFNGIRICECSKDACENLFSQSTTQMWREVGPRNTSALTPLGQAYQNILPKTNPPTPADMSGHPSSLPSRSPTTATESPTKNPSASLTKYPSVSPTKDPSESPTDLPITDTPTSGPVTGSPTVSPASCKKLNKETCKKQPNCIFGPSKKKICFVKKAKFDFDCSVFTKKVTCKENPLCGYDIEVKKCHHICRPDHDKKPCKQAKIKSTGQKICKYAKKANPCKKCQSTVDCPAE